MENNHFLSQSSHVSVMAYSPLIYSVRLCKLGQIYARKLNSNTFKSISWKLE